MISTKITKIVELIQYRWKENMNHKHLQNILTNIHNPCMKNVLAFRLQILSKSPKMHVYKEHHLLQ